MKSRLFASAALAAAASALAGAAHAAEAAATADAASVQELVVYGRGEARQVQTITQQEIQSVAPGSSPIKMVEKLPGVNFQSADAFGAYEWSTRISIRGFNQNQLGFTLDGVPLGDMSYGNFNGLHISRAIISEDLERVDLAQGSGSLETASTSNLGGTLKFFSRDPSHEAGATVAGTYGSDSTHRIYVRAETGDLPFGGRAYASFVDQKADKWKGVGEQKQRQWDFKVVQPLGDFTLTGFYDGSRRRENDYQDMSKGMIARLGYDWDNISGDYALAVRVADIAHNRGDTGAPPTNPAAGTVYPAPFQTVDDAYFNAAGLRDDDLFALTLEGPVLEQVSIKATAYHHKNDGQGVWFSPYVPSPNAYTAGATSDNAPLSVRTTEYTIDRDGAFGVATVDLGAHQLRFAGWYENNDFDQARRFYGLDRAANNRDSLKFMRNPFATQWAYTFRTETLQGSIEDQWTVNDALKVNFGFKAVRVINDSHTVTGAPVIEGKIESKDTFLPQVGATWRIGDQELFATYTENMRAFGAAHTGISPFATTQAGFNAIRGTLKPETSKTGEVGWRFRQGPVQGVVAAYYVKFDDRLIGTSAGAGIVGNPTILANAGGVTSKGFEAAATWTISDEWSLFGSYAYNDSQYDDDVLDSTGAVAQAISGKTVVDTPKHLLNAQVNYRHDGWFANLSAHYTAKRFYTFTNDQSVPSYTVVDATVGYRFDGEGWTKGLEIQVNATNLLDKNFVSTVGSNGFGYSGDNQTLLPGAPRQVFATIRKSF
ncbi:MAG: TonB-dependent receptor [Phenylobacterium sp.]|uniref:TonB-dependent receptor n=1 Tax=Phenylobacterium sp. TaxID=1871053 RepID=UPI0025F7CC4C|nr:TonB-dependent receptor [Phenylobacterium sp.]MBI1196458.1 TonB-dependent receptor [Phenylobacterium sp.]